MTSTVLSYLSLLKILTTTLCAIPGFHIYYGSYCIAIELVVCLDRGSSLAITTRGIGLRNPTVRYI